MKRKSNREIVEEYLRCFCDGDIEGLASLLSPDLEFRGTLYQYHSSEEYLDALRNDPPEKCAYRIMELMENRNSVAVFYRYEKPDMVLIIAQLFKLQHQKITEVHLVFDGRGINAIQQYD